MYADGVTASMRTAIGETGRRRDRQAAYNSEHGITPESIVKEIDEVMGSVYEADYLKVPLQEDDPDAARTPAEVEAEIAVLNRRMHDAAAQLKFEEAAALRDRVRYLNKLLVVAGA
jgi:excinuclease ABC subunit B